MEGYEFLRRTGLGSLAKTPAAAYKAAAEGLLPAAAFVYRSSSVRTLLEKPYDVDELERILAQRTMDYEMILLLMEIFEELLGHHDSDVALFAAEGINTLESRYNEKVKLEKALIEIDPKPEYFRNLATAYWELGGLQRKKPALRNFYLREAFGQLRRLSEKNAADERDGLLMAKILLFLDLHGQAREILHSLDPARKNPEILLLEAEAEFRNRDVGRVAEILREIASLGQPREERIEEYIDFWLGLDPAGVSL